MGNEINAEELVSNIEKYGSAEGDPTAKKDPAPEASQNAQPAPEASGFSFKSQDELLKHKLKYTASNKEVEEDLATILKRASQGYHYAQNMNAFNTQKAEFEAQIAEAKQLREKYGRFDDYAKENPQWYEHWNNAYLNRTQNLAEPMGSDGNIDQRVNALLEERLAPFKAYMEDIDRQKQVAALQNEDKALDEQVKSIREKYKDIDFDATDPESGKSLEYKVLEFGSQNGIKNFDVAFRAFYHDELVKRAREQQKDELAKQTQAQTKAGIVPGGTPGQKPQPNLKGLNHDQVMQLAAKEYGIQI